MGVRSAGEIEQAMHELLLNFPIAPSAFCCARLSSRGSSTWTHPSGKHPSALKSPDADDPRCSHALTDCLHGCYRSSDPE